MPNEDKNEEYRQKHGGKTLEESQRIIHKEVNDNPIMNAYKWLTEDGKKKKKRNPEDFNFED